ncbi:MAG TPA: hypothetical protein VJ103_02875 [Candidatus Paceibacterota bacterium]|nr:hypothetical protein [Candidatus Paceibacterota bacterium]
MDKSQPENLETERLEIAKKYKVADPNLLLKKEGRWYFKELPVEDWDRLYSKDEKEEYWKR